MDPFPKLLEERPIETKHVECAATLVAVKTGDVTAASNFTVSLLQLYAYLTDTHTVCNLKFYR